MLKKSIHTQEQKALEHLLQELRIAAGLRQEDLAARLGKPQSFVSKYETGERRLDVIELRHICHAVGIDLVEFSRRLEPILGG